MSLAPQAVEILLDDATDKKSGDTCVERVAALQERLECGGSRERMSGGDGGRPSNDRGPRWSLSLDDTRGDGREKSECRNPDPWRNRWHVDSSDGRREVRPGRCRQRPETKSLV